MAVATLNQNYYPNLNQAYYGQNNWSTMADGWGYSINQRDVCTKEEFQLSSLLRDSITGDPSLLDTCYELEPTEAELDPAIQELILQNESSGSNMMNYDSSEDFLIKQENVDSDNESVMLDHEDLNFLDRSLSVGSDDSNCYGHNSPKLRTSSRSSVDSGYEDSYNNIPKFDCIYNENKLCINTEGYDDIDELDSKPYCKSNRGAKKNLLWKFILETLRDKNQRLISWQDEREGTFKFDDTVTFSKKWGAKKGKNDMNFEKLSRAIRHYYKNGLMSRISTERLVYKFNWKSVPLRYRITKW